MIIDTSVLAAIAFGEPEAPAFVAALQADRHPKISAATVVEAGLVIGRATGVAGPSRLDALLASLRVEVVAFTPEQARLARLAHQSYGRGSGHRAKLNLGDCFSYALSIDAGEPLLFKGDDFVHTDVIAAL